MNTLTLIEHSFIYTQKDIKEAKEVSPNIVVPQNVFNDIKQFILKNSKESDDKIDNFLIPGYKKGYGEILKAKNYVGVIQTKKGLTIQILPKIYGLEKEKSVKEELDATKKIFFKMLRTLKKSNFKISNFANLDLSTMSLMDIFINMFLEELEILVKQGLRKAYIPRTENIFTLKGKLDFNKNIKHNFAHKERFYVNFDEHEINRPENKLLKSTLLLLNRKAKSNITQQRGRKNLFIFDHVDASKDIDHDFAKCKSNRLTRNYEKLLLWCRIFLKNKTFSNYKGDELAFALLFPMERIFEDYVAHQLRKRVPLINQIVTQKTIGKLLIDSNKYTMKPDLIFPGQNIIADTKWKIIDANHSMSQSDLYQMFAYGTHPKRNISGTQKIILIYPANPNFTIKQEYRFTDGLKLEIYPFDLANDDNMDIIQ